MALRSNRVDVVVLATVFVLSFLTYFTEEINPDLQVLPLALLCGFVVVRMFVKGHPAFVSAMLAEEALLYTWLVPFLTLPASIASHYDRALSFWAVDLAVVVAARLYTTSIPLRTLLEGYFWAGFLCVGIFTVTAFGALMKSIVNLTRLVAFAFHPNTLAFILAGSFLVAIWKWHESTGVVRVAAGITAGVSLMIIFFASSRGSLLALAGGGMVAGCFAAIKHKRVGTVAAWFCLALLAVGLVSFTRPAQDVWKFLNSVLNITNEYRGVGSGLSGRTAEWDAVLGKVSDGSWAWGNGTRASDGFSFPVDNGYLVLLYDVGILPLLVIVWRFGTMLLRSTKAYFATGRFLYLILVMMFTAFLLNNVVARYMYSVGNPFSVFMLMIFVSPWTRGSSREPAFARVRTVTPQNV